LNSYLKFITLKVFLLEMADVVCVFKGYWDVNVEFLIGNMYHWELGGYNLILRYSVCGQGIPRCKCWVVIWKFITAEDRRL
jgi:hypothetical protein